MKLYEISNKYEKILSDIDENGELSEQAVNQLSLLTKDANEKAIAISCFIKNLEAESMAIEEAKKCMVERARKINSRIDSIKNYLKHNMQRCGITEITQSPYFVIKLKNCPPSVHIENENLIPENYKIKKELISVDKNSIKNDISNGINVPGVRLIQDQRLEIK